MLKELCSPWTWRMALRDSRRQRKRLFLFSMSIMFGIAALVAVASLKDNLIQALNLQAKALVGSDVFLNCRNKPFSPEVEQVLKKAADQGLAEILREEAAWGNMDLAPGATTTNTVRVEARAVDPGFPWYGRVTTDPPEAWAACLAGEGIVVAPSLVDLGARPGTEVKLGASATKILGSFLQPPAPASWAGAMGVVSPEVFLARSQWKATLLGGGFFSFYRAHMKFGTTPVAETWAGTHRDTLRKGGVDIETSEKRRKTANEVLSHVYSFLSLLAFIALVLGGIGIGSAIHAYAQQRLSSVATLRCLGATARQTFAIYLLQGLVLGLLGSIGGVVLGVGLQLLLPKFFADQIPVEFVVEVNPAAVGVALLLGFLICGGFALLPLLKVRKVSPLAAVRASFVEESPIRWWVTALLLILVLAVGMVWQRFGQVNGKLAFYLGWVIICWLGAGVLVRARDPWWWAITALLTTALTLLALYVSPDRNRTVGVLFMSGLAVGLTSMLVVSHTLMAGIRLLMAPAWPFPIRQGFSNLYRPRNQTTLFLMSGGLVVALLLTMLLVRDMLLTSLEKRTLKDKPNLVALDVKADQQAPLREIVNAKGAQQVEYSPMVMMNLLRIGGQTLEVLRNDPKRKIEGWMLRHDFRSTFREELGRGETLVTGQQATRWQGTGPVPITIEKGLAEKLGVKLDDQLTFRVGSDEMNCRVTGFRQVQWEELGLNFFFVFPSGVFEGKPHTGVLLAKMPPNSMPATQRAIWEKFPGLQLFDLAEVFATLSNIIDKVGYVIHFMASFSVVTGILILIAVLLVGKNDRTRESVLLRTLGAETSTISRVLMSEYALLGLLAASTGALLAGAGSSFLAVELFKLPPSQIIAPSLIAVLCVTLFCLVLGSLLGRGVAKSPPLEVLRNTEA